MSALGSIEGGVASSQAASYNAKVAENNATIAQQNATHADQAGAIAAQNESMKGAAQSAQLKAAQAANGVDVNTGTAVDVQQSQRDVNQLDTETTANNAALQAYGYRTQASNDTAQAGLDKATASNDLAGGFIGATGSLLSNASSLSSKWSLGGNAASFAQGTSYGG